MNIEHLRPLSVSHENIQLYALLKESLATNAELRNSLLEAAETITRLTQQLWEFQNES